MGSHDFWKCLNSKYILGEVTVFLAFDLHSNSMYASFPCVGLAASPKGLANSLKTWMHLQAGRDQEQ